MESVMHFLGICPDHITHLNLADYLSIFSLSDLYWNIQMIYIHLKIKIGL
jgi:hypothetical protein